MHPTPIQILQYRSKSYIAVKSPNFKSFDFFGPSSLIFASNFSHLANLVEIQVLSNQSLTDTCSRPSSCPDPCPPNSAMTICSNRALKILKFFFRIPFAKAANNSRVISNIPISIRPRMCRRRIDN